MAVVEDTISRVFLSVYIKIAEAHKKKLKRLLGIWKDNERFSGETIATMEGEIGRRVRAGAKARAKRQQ